MARLKTRMNKIKEVLRLKFDCHLPNRSIAACLNIRCSTIPDIVMRFRCRQLAWPLPEDMIKDSLSCCSADTGRCMPDFPLCHQDKAQGHDLDSALSGIPASGERYVCCYSQFCNLYSEWLKLQKRSMHQHPVDGEKPFLNYCGPALSIVGPYVHGRSR